MQQCKSAQGGFTLLEMLIALSVLTIAVAGAVELAQRGLTQLNKTRLNQQASYYAYGHLKSLNYVENLQAGVQRGSYSDHHKWRLVLTKRNDEKALSADLTVLFDQGNREFNYLIILPPLPPKDDVVETNKNSQFTDQSNRYENP